MIPSEFSVLKKECTNDIHSSLNGYHNRNVMQHLTSLNKILKEKSIKVFKQKPVSPIESSDLFPENLILTLCNSWQALLFDVRREPEHEEKLSS